MGPLTHPEQDPTRLYHLYYENGYKTLCGMSQTSQELASLKMFFYTDLKQITRMNKYRKRIVNVIFFGEKDVPWLMASGISPFEPPQPLCLSCYGVFLLAST